MNRKLLLVPLLSVFAACNAPVPAPVPAQPDVTTSAGPPAAAETSATPAPAVGVTAAVVVGNALPEGVVISAPYALLLDHVVTNSDGLVRRQVSYKYPAANFDSASTTMEAAFKSAGFQPRPPRTQGNGDIVLTFDKAQFGTAYAILEHASADLPATRSLLVDFPASK